MKFVSMHLIKADGGWRECDDPVMWPSQRLHTFVSLTLRRCLLSLSPSFFILAFLIPLQPSLSLISIKRKQHAGFIIKEFPLYTSTGFDLFVTLILSPATLIIKYKMLCFVPCENNVCLFGFAEHNRAVIAK